jgi:class 3 adenylate cyclase/tetratricopeptide (TPR) repeat protein
MKCRKCQTELPDEANFCLTCGVNLHAAAPPSERPPEPIKPHLIPEPERKHVTALFSDLTGYTSMTEKLDPEQVKEITGRIFTGVKQIVAKYEGFVERVMGDGVLAFFGVPRAHEDDPIRAIHAAKEIHDLVKSMSPQYQHKLGAPLTMHSGINTGLVVTADVDPEKGTHGVAGDAVNVASRLSGLARPGEILVGHDTHVRAEGVFTFEDLGFRKVKGKAEPIHIFKVLSVKTDRGVARFDRQVSSEMVGRDNELDKIEFQVMKAINGEGSVVNVIGEAGIGKSRLIAELKKREVMKRITLLEGRAISIGKNLSFHPVTDLLKQWARIGDGDPESIAFCKLEKAIRAVHPKETHEILPFVATLMGMKLAGRHAERVKGIEGEALERLIFKNVRELIIKGAELRPTVIVMEDLHWADTSSIEILEALYRLAEKHRIAFINVFRPGYFESDDGNVASMGERVPVSYMGIEIQPLDNNNSEALIDNMLAIKGLPYTVKHQILERAGGNPFFIEEVVRSLIDEGALVKRYGEFAVTEKIEKVIIPATINDVLVARIDRLDGQTRELVKVASVIGRSFFDRIIKDVADSIEDVDQRLAYLKDVQLIRDRVRMREVEYLFKHALVQEAAYESTLIHQRKTLHLKVAQSIEKLFQERLHEFYGMLAYHYSKGEDLEKAEECMTKAGEEALRSSASSEALNYFRQALKLYVDRYGAKADPHKLVSFKKNLAQAHFNRGQYGEALVYLDEILTSKGFQPPESRLGRMKKAISDLAVIVAVAYFPVQRKGRFPSQQELDDLDLEYMKCWCLLPVDNQRFLLEGLSAIRKVSTLDLERIPQGPEWISSCPVPFIHLGAFSLSTRLLQRAALVTGLSQTGRGAIELLMTQSLLALTDGSWDSKPDLDSSVVDVGLRSGLLYPLVLYISILGILKAGLGMFDDAEDYAKKSERIADTYAYDFGRVITQFLTASTAIGTRSLDQALTAAESGIRLTEQAYFRPFKLRFFGYKAMAEALLARGEEAQLSVGEGESVHLDLGRVSPWYLTPFTVGRLLTHLLLLKEAIRGESRSEINSCQRNAYRVAKQAFRGSKKYAPYRTWILKLMGDYYWLIGKQRKALKWWDRSIKEGERLGAMPDLSRTYFEVGKRLVEPQSKYKQLNGIDANGYLEKAEKLFREMGLERDLEELERLQLQT